MALVSCASWRFLSQERSNLLKPPAGGGEKQLDAFDGQTAGDEDFVEPSGTIGLGRDLFVPIHRDGHKFLGVSLLATIIGFLLWSPLGWILLIVTAWIAYFFRDPDRVTPLREGLVVAPADGRVVGIEKVPPPPELGLQGGDRTRVSIFLSMMDCHVKPRADCRPDHAVDLCAGRVLQRNQRQVQ